MSSDAVAAGSTRGNRRGSLFGAQLSGAIAGGSGRLVNHGVRRGNRADRGLAAAGTSDQSKPGRCRPASSSVVLARSGIARGNRWSQKKRGLTALPRRMQPILGSTRLGQVATVRQRLEERLVLEFGGVRSADRRAALLHRQMADFGEFAAAADRVEERQLGGDHDAATMVRVERPVSQTCRRWPSVAA